LKKNKKSPCTCPRPHSPSLVLHLSSLNLTRARAQIKNKNGTSQIELNYIHNILKSNQNHDTITHAHLILIIIQLDSSSYNSIHHKKNITIIQLRFITRENHKKIRKKSCLYCRAPMCPCRSGHQEPLAGQTIPGASHVAVPAKTPPVPARSPRRRQGPHRESLSKKRRKR
jgi:hypothetical protein